ncbi:MAG: hypothetical protein V1494_00195 [Candidatus Diapherotrites archaeon]
MPFPSIEKKEITVIALIALSLIAALYFFNSSSLTLEGVLKFSEISKTIAKLLSAEFLSFLVLAPLPLALTAAYAKNEPEKNKAILVGVCGTIIGAIVSLAFFSGISDFALLLVFLVLGVFLLVENLYLRLSELKKWALFRATAESASKALLLVGVGLFVIAILFSLSNQKMLVDEFEQTLVEKIFPSGSGNSSQLSDATAALLINSQMQTLDALSSSPQFKALTEKEDADVQAYVLSVYALKQEVSSDEFREKLVKQINEQQQGIAGENGNLFELVKKQVPLFSEFEEFFWLIASLIMVSFYFLIANLVIKPLAVLYTLIISQAMRATQPIKNN